MTKEVESGHYQPASEVIRAGLRRLKQDQESRLPHAPVSREELEKGLLKAVASIDAGLGTDGEEVFARLRKRSKARRRNG